MGKLRARMVPDEWTGNPRHEVYRASLGTFMMSHGRYDFGDEPMPEGQHPLKLARALRAKGYVAYPVYLYDHGVQHLSTQSFVGRALHAEWDSGLVGVIAAAPVTIRGEYGVKSITKAVRARAEAALVAEIAELDMWLSGDVWRVEVYQEDDDGEAVVLDSLSGIFGADAARQEAVALLAEYGSEGGARVEEVW